MDRFTLFLLVAVFAVPGWATNGYFSHGFGTASKGMAGAGVALPLDSLSAASNPANMFHVGERMDIGISLFNPVRGYVADNNAMTPPFASIPPGKQDSDKNLFLVPSFGRNWKLDDNSTVGISIGANGGMNTSYSSNPFRNFGTASRPAGMDLSQLFAGLTYAHRLSERHTLGITPMLIIQSLKVEGLEPFQGLSIYPSNVTNNGRDWSYGTALRVGWLGKMTDQLSLGVSFQSRGHMTKFDKYKGLLAEAGDFDIPPQIALGLAWKASDKITIVLDYQKIYYEQIKSISNTNNTVLAAPANLGGDNGVGFGWRDVGVIKLGVEWQYSPKLTLRAGYSHASDAIPGEEILFNILAPAVVKKHVSIGATWKYNKQSSIHAAFTHGVKNKVSGGNPTLGPQTGSINLSINELEVSWSRSY